jgi:hypothetical protein
MPDPATTPAHEGGEKPLPCPFCGEPGFIFPTKNGFTAYCDNLQCHVEVQAEHESRDEAVRMWNTRAALAGTSADAGARETAITVTPGKERGK